MAGKVATGDRAATGDRDGGVALPGWQHPDHGALFVVSGPSGSGKTTLLKHALVRVPGIAFSVSATTRAPREGEREGVDYQFVGDAQFREMAQAGDLLEHAEVYGRSYGTPRRPVEVALQAGRSILLDIDTQGAAQVRRKKPEAVSIFVLPPSPQTIADRLRARGTDSEAVISRRIAEANEQLRECGHYHYLVMNDHLASAQEVFVAILLAELHRRSRRDRWVEGAASVVTSP